MDVDDLPLTLRLSWWGTAWLRGTVSPDELLDAVVGEAVTHVVLDPAGTGGGLVPALATARALGAESVAAAFPAAGDPVGLGGPPELTAAAIDAGEAVLLLGADTGLVPRVVGHAVEWTSYPARRRAPLDPGEADRTLRTTLLEAVNTLATLDVAAWNADVADGLHDLRTALPLAAPDVVPRRCVDLAGRALHLEQIVDLALADDGGAVSATEAEARRRALHPLAAAVRRALTAACSPDGWPPALTSSR